MKDSKGKMGEAYRKQDKAPKKGVPADDADEYKASKVDFQNLSVSKGKAYAMQAKAPTGRGSRGPTQTDGQADPYWDKPVSGSHKAYEAQCKWGKEGTEAPSMGFKTGHHGFEYLGHFAQDKFLRQGHNDGPNMNMDGVGYSPNGDSSAPAPSPSPDEGKGRAEMQKAMRKAFNYPGEKD